LTEKKRVAETGKTNHENKTMETKAKKIYNGILEAKKIRGLYNLDLDQVQSPQEAIRYCTETPGCRVDYQVRLVGNADEIEKYLPEINILVVNESGLGPFMILSKTGDQKNLFLKILYELSPDDIIKFCSSSKGFSDTCKNYSVYEKLTENLFQNAKKLRKDTRENFIVLWETRVSLDDFQAMTEDRFANHPDDVDKIFNTVVNGIEILERAGKKSSVTSSYNAVDVIILEQYPRKQLYEYYGFALELMEVFELGDNPEGMEDALQRLSDDSGVNLVLPYVEVGISQDDYIRLLEDVLPEVALERDVWIKQLNDNIVERIGVLEEEDPEDEDIETLVQLSSLQANDPYTIWIFRPDVLAFINVLIEKWQMLLDQRLSNLTEEEIFERYMVYGTFKERLEGGEDVWYSPDFNLLLESNEFKRLNDANLFRSEDLDEEQHLIVDEARWEEFEKRFQIYSE